MTQEPERLFREYEAILDQQYKASPIWRYPRGQALFGVLTVPDALYLDQMLQAHPPSIDEYIMQRVCDIHDGVSRAIRWLTEDLPEIQVTSTRDLTAIETAHDFAAFAADYESIADFHMMLGRGIAWVTIDEATKTVTFAPAKGPGLSPDMAWCEDAESERGMAATARQRVHPADKDAMRRCIAATPCRYEDGYLRVNGLGGDAFDAFEPLCSGNLVSETIRLDDHADLCGFSVSDFRSFCAAVHCWSLLAFSAFLRNVSNGVPQHETWPTQIVSQEELCDTVGRMSGIGAHASQVILDRMTYLPAKKADLKIKPFLSAGNMIVWSPSLFMQSRYERNMLKLMARGGTHLKDQADRLIGGRETELTRRIGRVLSHYGYQFKLRTKIASAKKLFHNLTLCR